MSSQSKAVYRFEKTDNAPPALFLEYPSIAAHVGHVCLGGFPSALQKIGTLGVSSTAQLFIKRDDVAGDIYGGNKVRKLEMLLGNARKTGAGGMLTAGFLRSGQTVATAIYARRVGLPVTCMLLSETANETTREQLLLSDRYGATLVHFNVDDFIRHRDSIVAEQVEKFARIHGAPPLIIPFGGTSAIGTVACVSAAFELKQQIDEALIPEPDYLYVPLATTGTAAGLACGLRAAGLKTRIVAIRVVKLEYANEENLLAHLRAANELLHSIDPSFPLLEPGDANFEIRHEFYGTSYGVPTNEAVEAINLLAYKESIRLEATYTGKTFAALLHDLRTGRLNSKTALFWHTANSKDLSSLVSGLDYHSLPKEFHQYF